MKVEWLWSPFLDLKPVEQYQMHQLRQKVFVIEQNCVYLDADGLDLDAWHLLGWKKDHELIAYLRVIPVLGHNKVKIGRVVTDPSVRKLGIGKELMKQGLAEISKTFGDVTIKMSAQLYLEKFYQTFGFKRSSDVYPEDGIPHIEMVL